MNNLLIVGAGPTGLTAAVELARRGIRPRIVDKKPKASTLSRAVGINPRTLHLLAESGVTEKLIKAGIKIRTGLFHTGEEVAVRVDFGLAPRPYDFLLALPQDETEGILSERLESYGCRVEYGVELKGLENDEAVVKASIQQAHQTQTVDFDHVFGADGIRSRVRTCAGIPYDGIELPDEWSIVDFESESWPHRDDLCIFLFERGRVFLTVPIGEKRFRGVSDRPDAVKNKPESLKIDSIRREGRFAIWVKQAPSYQKGRVFIGGDAAHCHSPVGGRGMNLGMGDAACFAELFAEDRLDQYTAFRHPVGASTIRVTERARKFATSSFPGKFLVVRYLVNSLLKLPGVQARTVRVALDCPI